MDRDSLAQLLGEGLSLAEIGRRFGLHESTVGYWLKKYDLQAAHRGKHLARGGLIREELQPLVEQGASVAEIADAVERSKTTVRHWLQEYGLTTSRAKSRREAGASHAEKTGDVLMRTCVRHGFTEFKDRTPSGYRCLKCRSEAVTRRRRRVKQTLVEEAGGACCICGYRRCIAALEFHHIDPASKRFSLSHRGVARSIERARDEARKCALLCANCHVEVETGIATLSLSDDAA